MIAFNRVTEHNKQRRAAEASKKENNFETLLIKMLKQFPVFITKKLIKEFTFYHAQ